MSLKIYLAHPISGLSYDEVADYYDVIVPHLQDVGYQVFNPLTGKDVLRNEIEFKVKGYEGIPLSSNHAIKQRDQWMVSQADIVWCNFLKCKNVSIGMVSELAWADLQGKHTIVTMQEDNIHQHAFILEMADVVFETELESLNYLQELIN